MGRRELRTHLRRGEGEDGGERLGRRESRAPAEEPARRRERMTPSRSTARRSSPSSPPASTTPSRSLTSSSTTGRARPTRSPTRPPCSGSSGRTSPRRPPRPATGSAGSSWRCCGAGSPGSAPRRSLSPRRCTTGTHPPTQRTRPAHCSVSAEEIAAGLERFGPGTLADAMRRDLGESMLDARYVLEGGATSLRLAHARPAGDGPPDVSP